MNTDLTILQKPINQIHASEYFENKCGIMGFQNLEEILACNQAILQKKAEFSYLWLEELLSILSEHQLLTRWQPITGKSSF